MGTYLVIDGNSLTYRAFFALPTDMATASGQVTNAVFGFTSMLINVLKDHTPDGVLVAFDRPEPTFRHEAEPLYKAQRDAAPDILRQQMGLVREVLDAVGITAIDLSGWEADDIIATVSDRLVDDGHQVLIVTGDRDSYQLVRDPDVKVLYNKRGVSDYALYDEAGIEERTGVAPSLYVQYAALRGDNSDNLPGVPGVGEKTAAKLINAYGGLDGIFEHVDDQTPKLRSNLAEHEERARKNLDLMQLRHDAPIGDLAIDDLGVTPNADELKRLFDFLEFRTLAGRLDEALSAMGTSVDLGPADDRAEIVAEVTTSGSPNDAAAAIASAGALDIAATWAGEPGRSPLAGIAVVVDASVAEVLWIPADVLADDAVRAALGAHANLRGHNVKPLMRSLLEFDVEVRGLTLDTAIAAYLIDPAEARYTLPDLIEKYTKFARPSDDAAGSGQLDLDGTSLGDAELAARDALAVNALAEPIVASMEAQGMAGLYRTIENPLVLVLAKMEHVGIGVDVDELRALGKRLSDEVQTLQIQLREVAGRDDLNLNSPKQLREILVRRTWVVPREEDQDRLFDRCGDAGEDQGPVARVPRTPDEVPRSRKAPLDLWRGPPGRGGGRRAHPRHVQPDGGPHGPPVVRPAESPQHPGTHRRGTAVPHGVRAGAGHHAARGRLQPDRTAVHRPPRKGPRADRRVHERPGHPQRHRSARVRRRAGVGDRRAAIEGEDGVVRARLRDGGLRARPAVEHPDRGGCSHPRCVLLGLPQREALHGPHSDRGARTRLHRDVVRSSPTDPRADELELPGPSGW